MFAKLSILAFYHRLCPGKITRWATYIVAFSVVGSYLSVILALIFSCRPLAKLWQLAIKTGTCTKGMAQMIYICPALNITTSFAILFMPLPILWRLQLPRRQKIGLGLIFVAGSMSVLLILLQLPSNM